MTTLAEAARALVPRWWEALGAQSTYDALVAAIDTGDWGEHDLCSLTACRNPLHPGPCKGWKHTLHLVSPGAFHALEKSRVEKLNAKRVAKIEQLKSEGKKIPLGLLKPILPKAHPGPPPPGWHPGDLAPGHPAHLADKVAGQHAELVHGPAHHAAAAANKAAGIVNKPSPNVHAASYPSKEEFEALAPADKTALLTKVAKEIDSGTPDQKAAAKGFLEKMHPPKAPEPAQVGIKGVGTVTLGKKAAEGTMSHDEAMAHVAKVVAEHPVGTEPVKFPGTQTLAEKKMADHLLQVVSLSKSGSASDKLAAYDKITAESWAKLSPAVQEKIKNDLTLMEGKFKSTNSGVKVFGVQDKIKGFEGKSATIPGKVSHGHAEKKIAHESPMTAKALKAKFAPAPAARTTLPTSGLTSTGKSMGGTHGAKQLKDEHGNLYVFKPAGNDKFTAHAEAGANKLARKVGLPAPVTTVITHDGKFGSVQQHIEGKPAFGGKHIDPAKLSDADVLAIQKQHVVDWLTGNHDSHGAQWIRTPDGKLVEIDKAQSFKHYGNDVLSASYHPNAKYGEAEPIYNQLYQAAKNGQVKVNDPSTGELAKFIDKVQALPAADVKAMFRPYAESAHAAGKLPGGGTPDDFLNKIVTRKNSLATDFAKLHTVIKPPPAKTPVPEPHLDKGVDLPGAGKKFEILSDTGKNGDGYYIRPDGSKGPWGKYGAAGVLISAPGPDGEPRYLLVQRGPGVSSNKGKWQLPGGALNSKENAHQGAARELHEELSTPEGYLDTMTPHGEHVYQDHDWKYTTIGATAPAMFEPKVDATETGDAKWVTAAEMAKMDADGQLVPPLSKGALQGHVDKLLPKPAAKPAVAEVPPAAKPATPALSSELPTHVQTAQNLAGMKTGTSKMHLEHYGKLSKADFDKLTPQAQANVIDQLKTAKAKFLDPKKQAAAQDLLAKFGTPGSPLTSQAAMAELGAKKGPDLSSLDNLAKLSKDDVLAMPKGDQAAIASKLTDTILNGKPDEKEKAKAIALGFYSEVGAKATHAETLESLAKLDPASYAAMSDKQKGQILDPLWAIMDDPQAHGGDKVKAEKLLQDFTDVGGIPSTVPAKPTGTKSLASYGVDPYIDTKDLSHYGKVHSIGSLSKSEVASLSPAEHKKMLDYLAVATANGQPGTAAEVDKFLKFHGLKLPEGSLGAKGAPSVSPAAPAPVAVPSIDAKAKALAEKLAQNEHQTPKHDAITALTKDEYDALPFPVQAQVAATIRAGVDKQHGSNVNPPKATANADKLYGGSDKIPQDLLAYQKATDQLWPGGAAKPDVTANAAQIDSLAALDKATWDKADPEFRTAAEVALHNAQANGTPAIKAKAIEAVAKFGLPALAEPGKPSEDEAKAAADAATWKPTEAYLNKAIGQSAKAISTKAAREALFHGTGNNYTKYKAIQTAMDNDPSISAAATEMSNLAGEHAKASARERVAMRYRDNLVKAGLPLGHPDVAAADKAYLAASSERSKAEKEYLAARAKVQAKFTAARKAAGLNNRKVPAYYEGAQADALQSKVAYNSYSGGLGTDATLAEKSMGAASAHAVAPWLLPGTYKNTSGVSGESLGGATPLGAGSAHKLLPPPSVNPPINAVKAKPAPTYNAYHGNTNYPHPAPAEGALPDAHFVAGHGMTTSNDHGADPYANKDAYVLSEAEAEALNTKHGETLKGSAAHNNHVAISNLPNGKGEREATKSYTGGSYHSINDAANQFHKTGKWGTGSYAQEAKVMAEAFKNGTMPKLSKPITVYRGFSNGDAVMGHDAWGPNMAGTVFTNHAFSSTSTFYGKAKGFSGANGKNSVVMRIHVPAGTPTVSAAKGGHVTSEKEFILGPDTTYKVVADYGWHEGVRMIDVEVIPNAHTASAYARGRGVPPRSLADAAAAIKAS